MTWESLCIKNGLTLDNHEKNLKVKIRINYRVTEACQSGRLGLTANELAAETRSAGSTPTAGDKIKIPIHNENQINTPIMKTKEIIGTSLVHEARKNPHLNPKVPINFHISQHYENADKIRGTQIVNSFVSFTEIDKIGINPKSHYNTPLGIYSYPSEYILEQTASIGAMRKLPFAGDLPHANIFSVAGNIIDLSSMSDQDVTKYAQQMVNVFIEVANIRRGGGEWKKAVDYLEDKVILNAPVAASNPSLPASRFWWLTREMSSVLMEHSDTRSRWQSTRHSVSWNKLFRTLRIDGCVDSDGDGIIHTSEPLQAVFFSVKPIKKVERRYNKYSPEDVEKAEAFGSKILVFKSADPDEMAKHIMDNPDEYRSNPQQEVKFIEAIHPVDPKIQTALLYAFFAHPNPIGGPIVANAHVFSGVEDSDIIKVVDKAKYKGHVITNMIEAGLITQHNITPEIVNVLIEDISPMPHRVAYIIKRFNPGIIEPIISMAKINDQNISRFFQLGTEYFNKMRGSAAAMDRMIDFGKALVDAGGNKALIKKILDRTQFDEDDIAEVMDAVFGD